MSKPESQGPWSADNVDRVTLGAVHRKATSDDAVGDCQLRGLSATSYNDEAVARCVSAFANAIDKEIDGVPGAFKVCDILSAGSTALAGSIKNAAKVGGKSSVSIFQHWSKLITDELARFDREHGLEGKDM